MNSSKYNAENGRVRRLARLARTLMTMPARGIGLPSAGLCSTKGIIALLTVATLCLLSAKSSASVIFSGYWPQETSNPVTTGSSGTAWTYSNVSTNQDANDIASGSTIVAQSNSMMGMAAAPDGSSTDALTEFINTSNTSANFYVVSTAADDLGTFQPDTSYTLSFYVGNRSTNGWDSTESLTEEITDGLGEVEASTVVTLADLASIGKWYQFSASFTTGDIAPSGNITLEFLGYQGETGNHQMIYTDYSLSAVSTPEPVSTGFLGLLSIGALARRRRTA